MDAPGRDRAAGNLGVASGTLGARRAGVAANRVGAGGQRVAGGAGEALVDVGAARRADGGAVEPNRAAPCAGGFGRGQDAVGSAMRMESQGGPRGSGSVFPGEP